MPIDKRLIFYEGKHVCLKVLDEQDIVESGWMGWFNDEALCQTNQHHYFPNTFAAQRAFLEPLNTRKDKLQLGIVSHEKNDKICGVVSLNSIDLINRNAEISGFQNSKITKSNPFIFYEAWSLMLRHGFDQFGLKKIHGGAFRPFSVEALRRVFNFEIEGVRKKHVFKNGTFHDTTLIAVFDETIKYPEL